MNKRDFLKVSLAILVFIPVFLTFIDGHAAGQGYRFGPSDIVSVMVFAGGESQIAVDLTVSEQGFINFPFLGSVKAAGLTASELEEKVLGPLEKEYFVDPQVHVSIREYNSLSFSISGAVKTPGKYPMGSVTTVMDLIAKAGGVVPESGKTAYVIHEDSGNTDSLRERKNNKDEPLKVDLKKLLDEGDVSHNILLKSGDLVYIPFSKGLNQAETKVYVSGKVQKPALYDYQSGLTALSACLIAGGFAPSAAPNRAIIVRDDNGRQKIIRVDLEEVVNGKNPDVPLQPGDRIHVPESWF